MKNILFIHSSAELYGSDRSLLNTIRYMDKSKYNIYVLLPIEGPLASELRKVEGVDVIVHPIAVLRRKNLSLWGVTTYFCSLVVSYFYIMNIIRKQHISIVDTNTAVIFGGALAAKSMRIKSVWHIREIINSRFENKVISKLMELFSDVIVANSMNTGRALNVSKNKVRIVYNAVEESRSAPQRNKINAGIIIGMAGRINHWKGQSLFIGAAKKVVERYPQVKFLIAGDAYAGEEYLKDNLKSEIEKLDLQENVTLLGQVSDMNSFYSGLDIFVLPSIQPEPFGLVVIEAMDYALPVVATNHGGPTEILKNGDTGYLVDYKNSEEMAQRLNELIADSELRDRMGTAARKDKRRRFSVTKMVKDLSVIYDEL
ncbi:MULTISPECIES: glycosyltransferase family 4 protein [Lactiplantibacillus]|uniref:glycosyltransferase family 4 protein n=1 Tax=Lactiplantibacillus TaxID=2767842 RepID=UPI001C201044|nr:MULTISPECIES: glycosyltransferase family 4 protein [Lactiplantibacillus]MBU7527295.1 glycosyltransferase family 4 protein [Lactiplantibacillus pentosus]MCT3233439.1 glycosyltransferase family 1 protein [Lactiplantibacillus plantarum]MCT3550396.1 glycosyltransferase family 1 protein [Lactiplantibacillus plantarum]MDN7061354.1 glycosyltransferase family 4 protein [Lactiplantibacillus plantarum]MDT6968034.1 glycosyltransferase family 4 protein [Lactiplantibacillus pentosus]